jgi:hypothetical protein
MNNIIKIILCIIILYILYCNIFQSNNNSINPNSTKLTNSIITPKQTIINDYNLDKTNKNDKIMKYKFDNLKEKKINIVENNQQIINYDKPNPWTKLVINENNEYPYYFHIKINIPSLTDYTNWKNIIPNLDFNVSTGELIIPSKDEASALAITNLFIMNINGDLKLEDILHNNLIETSITKSKNYEVVQNKFRDQINQKLSSDYPDNKDINNDIEYKQDLDKLNTLDPEPYDGDNYMYFND